MGLQQLAKAMEDMPNMHGMDAWQDEGATHEDTQNTSLEDRGVGKIELHCYDGENESVVLADYAVVITDNDAYVLGESKGGRLLISGPLGNISAHAVDENTFEMFDPAPFDASNPNPEYVNSYIRATNALYLQRYAARGAARAAIDAYALAPGVSSATNAARSVATSGLGVGAVASFAALASVGLVAAGIVGAPLAAIGAISQAISPNRNAYNEYMRLYNPSNISNMAQRLRAQAVAQQRARQTGGGSYNANRYIGGAVGAIQGGGWRL